ncbi:endonuclease/exonuclease/phosphatase family protein [Flavobacterium agrisoli]|uniref:Endonuclease/exonuclease/phosphatase family protein n=1 Tax=Flavobacterium agrisoli TaxID=2793066 RepID=A0A934PMK2_9FLAO|nr:endonuclease/exonuclease/phosphatase family protein [Flavobacterium agrisoli]MBK0369148.1 endonuclease/exonuclease/phosphatase family protein [Flavobacterium agrisoli]
MRIIEWNCQGAFRLKNIKIFELKPDILIIPECEEEQKLQFGKLTPTPNDFIWYGDAGKKGIGIFSFTNYKFKILKEFNPEFRYVIPLEVSNGINSFLLFAVWAMDNKKNPIARYIGQVWNAVNYYQTNLANNIIIVGDFNSNQIWDEKERIGNHTDVVNFLNNYNIESLYHKQYNEIHGQESLKTFFMYRNLEKSYHIDYVFASHNLIKNGYNLKFGNPENWIDKSDHVPLVLEISELSSQISIQNTFTNFTNRNLNSLSEDIKVKYAEELSSIKKLAEKLDLQTEFTDEKFELIDKIETIKKIDKLTIKLK